MYDDILSLDCGLFLLNGDKTVNLGDHVLAVDAVLPRDASSVRV